jgi:hypothetical protein
MAGLGSTRSEVARPIGGKRDLINTRVAIGECASARRECPGPGWRAGALRRGQETALAASSIRSATIWG